MAINCNEITQVATELKMKFENCKVLKAEDLDTLVELVEAVNNCEEGSTISFTNEVKTIEGDVVLSIVKDTQHITLTDNASIVATQLPSVGFSKRIRLIVNSENSSEILTLPNNWQTLGSYDPNVVNKLQIEINNTTNGVYVECLIFNLS